MHRLLDLTSPLDDQPLEETSDLDASPRIAFRRLAEFAADKIGVWEMTPGTTTYVEEDEVFFVLSGSGTLIIDDETTLALNPGTAVRLHAGERTTWIVLETLRKIYIC